MDIVPECTDGITAQAPDERLEDKKEEEILSKIDTNDDQTAFTHERKSSPEDGCTTSTESINQETKKDCLQLPSIQHTPAVTINKASHALPSLLPPPPKPVVSSFSMSLASNPTSHTISNATPPSSFSSTQLSNQMVASSSAQANKTVVPLDMMPTIPLVPVQLPLGRGGVVSLASKTRGRPRGMGGGNVMAGSMRSGLGILKRGTNIKMKRIGSGILRGGRRLAHSTSLDDRGVLGLRDDHGFHLQDDVQYSQDDMFVMPSFQEKWPGRVCAFCSLPESSQLGQGEFNRYEPTPGFSWMEKSNSSDDSYRDMFGIKRFKSAQAFRDKMKSPRKPCEGLSETSDEKSLVGHLEKNNSPSHVFSSSGQCYAHYMCALWSMGVELTSEDAIACVDKAVVAALERRCFYCKKFGASIPCRVPGCMSWYHFPCATTSGAFLDLKSIAMVCPPHSDRAKDHLVDLACMLCDHTAPEATLLFCCSCGNHYHGLCLKPALTVTPTVRAGWQCPDCKICQMCRQPGDEIVCVVCNKAYHSVCARPQGLTHSRTGWKCKSCRVCGDCGSRIPGNGLSSRWHANFTVCDSCYQLRNKGLACPVCKKAYRAIMQKSMAQCTICRRHVHSQCDSEADLNIIHTKWEVDKSYEYICRICRNNPTARLQASTLPPLPSPDHEDVFESPQHPLTVSEDSMELDLGSEDSTSSASPLKPITSCATSTTSVTSFSLLQGGGSFSNYYSNSSIVASLSSTTSSTVTSSTPGWGSSSFSRGKPWAARRGSFPRVRGSISNKYNLGKKGVNSGRKRGGPVHTARKGRGNTAGRGYRGYFNYQTVTLPVIDTSHGTGKEDGEENKIIVVNANEKFSLWQDVCVMCGSFGQDHEGRLISCAQCGQCYHPYCANVKVNKVVLEKGWRCLDCTVCEGCGERNDEARLVLCEDCDISCHIYCMTPPLDQVPAGIWKCRWCAVCQYCGSTDPGLNSMWQQNYSMCGPCFSTTTCPVCDELYTEAELIIQCSNCMRWLHASDDSIDTEEQAEKCIEKGYLCLMCRSPDSPPPHLLPDSPPRSKSRMALLNGPSMHSTSLSSAVAANGTSVSPVRSESPVDFLSKLNSNTHHWMDGTCLSDVGLHQIQNMTLQPIKKTRNFRGGLRTRGLSLDSTGSRDLDDEDDDEEDKVDGAPVLPQHWVYGMKEGTILNAKEHGNPPDLPDGYYTLPGPEPGTFVLRKRRYRNIKTVGIGGFQVRVRAKKEEEKAKEEAEMDPQALELRRKRSKWRTKKKIKILEQFPSYMQEAFFGRSLMDTSNLEEDLRQIEDLDDDDSTSGDAIPSSNNDSIKLSQDEVDMIEEVTKRHELAKERKLDGFHPMPIEANIKTERVTPSQPKDAPSTSNYIKPDDKKVKEEKVDELVEDDENNEAIEALFGAGGGTLISDALMRDIMNEGIKDDSSFIEGDEKDQIEGVGSKLTDIFGPGFNLEEVADIMKNLPEETTDDPSQSVDGSSSTKPVDNHSIIKETSRNPVDILNTSQDGPQTLGATQLSQQSILSNLSQSTNPPNQPYLQNQPPSIAPVGNISEMINREPRDNAPVMSKSTIMLPQAVPVPTSLPFQEVPQSPSLQSPRFLPEANQSSQVQMNRPPANEFHSNNSMQVIPNATGSMQMITKQGVRIPPQHIIQQVRAAPQPPLGHPTSGQIVTAANVPLNHKTSFTSYNQPISNIITKPVQQSPGSIPVSNQHPEITALSANNMNLPQQSNPLPAQTPRPSCSYNTNDPSSSSINTPTVLETPKTWPSENQSLSLSLEEDEALGDKATKAAVLYSNIHKPSMRSELASIHDRERQIKRVWKNLDADERRIYTQRARENKKEYFKNKQELQRALKSQEKEGTISTPQAEYKQVSQPPNAVNPYSQQQQSPANPHISGQFIRRISTVNPGTSSITQHPVAVENENIKRDQLNLQHGSAPLPDGTVQQDIKIQNIGGTISENVVLNTSQSASGQTVVNQSILSQGGGNNIKNDSYVQLPYSQLSPLSQDNAFLSQSRQGSQQVEPDVQFREVPKRQVYQQASFSQANAPTRLQTQFRQPLPPIGSSQQVRVRFSGPTVVGQSPGQVNDQRMRLLIQQQRLQQQQQIQRQQHILVSQQQQQGQQQILQTQQTSQLSQQMQQAPLQAHPQLQQQQPSSQQIQQRHSPLQQQVQPQQSLQLQHNQIQNLPQAQQQLLQQPQIQSQQQVQQPPQQLHSQLGPSNQHPHSQPPSIQSSLQSPSAQAQLRQSPHQLQSTPQSQQIIQQPLQQHNLQPLQQQQAQLQQPQRQLQSMNIINNQGGINNFGQGRMPQRIVHSSGSVRPMQTIQRPYGMGVQSAGIPTVTQSLQLPVTSMNSPMSAIHQSVSHLTQSSVQDSEIPEAVTREIESFEQGQQQKKEEEHQSKNVLKEREKVTEDLSDITGGPDLQQMDVDLLSSIDGDFKDLLDYADSDHDRSSGPEDSKLPNNLFDNLDEDSNESQRKKLKTTVTEAIADASKSLFQEQHQALIDSPSQVTTPPGHSSSGVPQGPPSGGQGSTPGTPGTPGSHPGTQSPLTPGGSVNQIVGPSSGPIMGSPRMTMAGSPNQPQGHSGLQNHMSGVPQGYTRMVCPPGASPLIRQPAVAATHPPPPYPGHSQTFQRSQEQPLLIEEIIEEEKREQMKQQKALANQHQHPPPPTHLSQQASSEGHSLGNPILRPPYQRMPAQIGNSALFNQTGGTQTARPVRPPGDPGMHPALLMAGSRPTPISSPHPSPASVPIKTLDPPPVPPDNPQTEAELQQQQQYEKWLNQQAQLIQSQQNLFETEINKQKKRKKSLLSRQRTMKKNGQELNELESMDLERVQRVVGVIQRQLDACRKASRQHSLTMSDYANKKRQRQTQIMQSPTAMMTQPIMAGSSPLGPAGSSPMHSTPQSPLMTHSPSSQHSMGMSPLVPSPHTPAASPSHIAVPQHSPHSMVVVPTAHPSPGEHSMGSFSPQTRMPSPGAANTFPGPQQMVHPMISPQNMRVRMPVHSPGTVGPQSGSIASHMMVIRQNYSQNPNMMAQQQGQQVLLRQYPQNVMPIRRPSGSGPVPSPGSSGLSPSQGAPPPSPVSTMAMKPSPVHGHSGLKSPVPLASPQMRPHSVENPGTPLTPRSVDPTNNPATPHSDYGAFGSQVSSPHHSILTPTPPSPVVNCGSASNSALFLADNSNSLNGNSNLVASENSNNSDKGMMTDTTRNFNLPSSNDDASSTGGGGNSEAPIPIDFHVGRFGYFTFGLKGGSFIRSRWGHFKIGLKGGQPIEEDESTEKDPLAFTPTTPSSVTTNSEFVTTTSTSGLCDSVFSSCTKTSENMEGSLMGVLGETVRGNRIPRSTMGNIISQPAYVSAGTSEASVTPRLPLAVTKVVVPEPAKSEIPPSSRHQAVIGIPGGGAIPSQPVIYPASTIEIAPGIRLPMSASSSNYYSSPLPSVTHNPSDAEMVKSNLNSGFSLSDTMTSSPLITTPIMSVTTTTSNSILAPINKQPVATLAKDVNTLATVVSASSQVSNVLVSLNSTRNDPLFLPPVTSFVVSGSGPTLQNTTSNIIATGPPYSLPSVTNVVRSSTPLLTSNLQTKPSILSTISTSSSTPVSALPAGLQQSISRPPFQNRSLPGTLHHHPHQKVVLTSAMQSAGQGGQQQPSTPSQVVTSILPQNSNLIGTTIQQPNNLVVHNQSTGSGTQQIVQLPSLSQLNSSQINKTQVVHSAAQYPSNVQSPSGQLIVQQSQPSQHGGMVITGGSSYVRMMGQQVMMQQGVIRGNSVMVKTSPQVQGGVRMMMIHNNGQRAPTPPPVGRQTSPMMPPPAAKSPASHSASPIPRVSPAQSPIPQSPSIPSPHSPQVKSQSPHTNSPIPSPQHSSSTPPTLSQVFREDDARKSVGSPLASINSDEILSQSAKTNILTGGSRGELVSESSSKETSAPSAPNALLKQLLQNACSSNAVQPGQLVLVRSSQLSQIAGQASNNVALQRTLSDGNSTQIVTAITSQNLAQTVTGSSPAIVTQVGRPTLIQQQATVISGSTPQALSKSVSSLPVVGGTNNTSQPYVASRFPYIQGQGSHPQSLLMQSSSANIRQVTYTQAVPVRGQLANASLQQGHGAGKTYIASPAGHHSLSQHSLQSVTHNRQPQQSPNITQSILQGVSSTQLMQKSQSMSPLATQNASLAERIDNNPSVKTEMRVLIPENVASGPSTGGDQTPELHTPNDSCDDPDDSKKVKKRTQSQSRRKSQTKDNKVQPAKRMRQSSRVEEDYDSYVESMMTQLRAMPPVTIVKPDVSRNFNSCPIYGFGDFSKLHKKDINTRQGLLEGEEGKAKVKNMNDYYNTKPFGPNLPILTPSKPAPAQKGFYTQEFPPPKIGLPLDECYSELESITLNKSTGFGCRDTDSPDTVLSSSSPECVMPESPPPFKGLRLIEMNDMEDDHRDRTSSPTIPLMVPIPERHPVIWDEKLENKENKPSLSDKIMYKSKVGLTPALPIKDTGKVTVTLTLSSNAGQDIANVLRSLSNLLNIPPPHMYDFHENGYESLPKTRKTFKHNKEGKELSVDLQSVLNGALKFCKSCNNLILQNTIKKKITEMSFLAKEDWAGVDDLSFCSKNCYSQFAVAHKVYDDKSNSTSFADGKQKQKEDYLFRESKDKSNKSDSYLDWHKDDCLDEVLKVPYFDERKGKKRKMDLEEEYPRQPDGKRFRGHQYKYWSPDALPLPEKYEKPTDKEMTDLLFRMRITYMMSGLLEDMRRCILCHLHGDYIADGPSRLLNYDVDKWVHLNCALWADDVYETMSGSLMQVELAMKKAGALICEHCERSGASVKCFKPRCTKVYHLNCAVKVGCTFYKNKTVFCHEHINKGERDNELSTLAVFRRVFIDRDESRQIASVIHHTEMNKVIRIGSLVLISIGQLLPHHLQAFHSPYCIYPVGYQVIRFYWSMRKLSKRCAYECSIHEVDGQPEFRIVVKEEGFDDLTLSSRSAKGVWNKILVPISEMRARSDAVKLFPQYISGEDLFGLTEPAIVRILESMPGVDSLSDYTFKYGSNPLFELPLAVNPTGCARSEPFNRGLTKRHHGIRTTVGTVKTGGNLRTAATIASLTMNFDPFVTFGKPFAHSRYYHYKRMKNEWRSTVYLARSKIQGLGLYAAKDIEKNTMIIEYIGEIIREELSEIREKRYESQNRGIYMFRLDDSKVVDATVTGGLARYINHCCDPNCYTETIEIEKEFKITIVSNRKILRGEELAYDYKFDEEEDHKIPCLCGADNCRKWMN